MENFYVTIENEEDKVEELINLSKASDPQILLN
jgi:magnesium transporter